MWQHCMSVHCLFSRYFVIISFRRICRDWKFEYYRFRFLKLCRTIFNSGNVNMSWITISKWFQIEPMISFNPCFDVHREACSWYAGRLKEQSVVTQHCSNTTELVDVYLWFMYFRRFFMYFFYFTSYDYKWTASFKAVLLTARSVARLQNCKIYMVPYV